MTSFFFCSDLMQVVVDERHCQPSGPETFFFPQNRVVFGAGGGGKIEAPRQGATASVCIREQSASLVYRNPFSNPYSQTLVSNLVFRAGGGGRRGADAKE
jgi:hypothetical protein